MTLSEKIDFLLAQAKRIEEAIDEDDEDMLPEFDRHPVEELIEIVKTTTDARVKFKICAGLQEIIEPKPRSHE